MYFIERASFRSDYISFLSPINPTALTVHNIVQELRGVDVFDLDPWSDETILGIPAAQLAELQSSHHSTDEQEAAVVRYWLLRYPLASWRRIIHQLDVWANDPDYDHYSDIADRIRHYAEELTGMFILILDTMLCTI